MRRTPTTWATAVALVLLASGAGAVDQSAVARAEAAAERAEAAARRAEAAAERTEAAIARLERVLEFLAEQNERPAAGRRR